ncbi:MAG: tRNA lysidine(34) synthetase TilS [Phycisphaerales bacterium]|nr:tRNA lysidine(34) synthetase TilS [Phycisphaerales bacterium]
MIDSSSESGHLVPLAARRHSLIHEIRRGLRMSCGGEDPGHLVLAVSGGRDSLALLIAAVVLREQDECAILPRVVHVHHHLRPEADSEADHVVAVAKQLDVPSEVRHVDVPTATAAEARRVRYEALVQAACDCRSPLVATGHHAEDQLETIIAALGRGAGPSGLAGMQPRRHLDREVYLIRPMLGVSRDDAGSLCEAADVDWCDDPGNSDVETQRGRLRRDILPVLESMWPGVARRVASMAEAQSVAATALEGLVSSVFGPPQQICWERKALSHLPMAVIMTGLRRAILATGKTGSDSVSRQSLVAASDGIGDHRSHPRTYEVGAGLFVLVDARQVKVQVGDS